MTIIPVMTRIIKNDDNKNYDEDNNGNNDSDNNNKKIKTPMIL